jgi:hypothetical protein
LFGFFVTILKPKGFLMRNRFLSCSSTLILAALSLLAASESYAAAAASSGIVMLPPQDMAGNVCANNEDTANDTYGILQWDGKSPIRCVKGFFSDSSGNLGVGTLTPAYKFDVLGTSRSSRMVLDEGIAANGGAHLTINRPTLAQQGLIAFRGSETPYMYGSMGINSGRDSLDILSLTPHDVIIGSYTDAVNRNDTIVVKPDGNVGIGKSDPFYKVDVDGTLRSTRIYMDTKIANNGGGHITVAREGLSNQAFMVFSDKETGGGYQLGTIGIPSSTKDFNLASFNGANLGILAGGGTAIPGAISNLRLYSTGETYIVTGGTRRVTIPKTGNVGIGTATPGYALHVNGTAYASGAAGALSDERHKEKVRTLELPALETLRKLRPVTYHWKKIEDVGMKGEQIGFIAQEVEKVLPQVVLTQDNEEKTKGLKYDEIIPVLTKAVQELDAENKKLKLANESLEARLDVLEKKMSK